jgi:hypothetical protein
MKKTLLTLSLALVTAAALAAPGVLRKSGNCKLQVGDMFDDSKAAKVTLSNADVEAVCTFRGDDDFFGSFVVIANPSLKNKSGKKLDLGYHVAFFDKDGHLVAVAQQAGDLDADAENHQFASCIAHVPREEFEKIVSYKVVIYLKEFKERK